MSSSQQETAVPEREDPRTYPADKVRQGEVILKKRRQRIIFLSGIVGLVLLALFLRLVVYY